MIIKVPKRQDNMRVKCIFRVESSIGGKSYNYITEFQNVEHIDEILLFLERVKEKVHRELKEVDTE